MSRVMRWTFILVLALQGLVLFAAEGARVFERCLPCHKGNGGGQAGIYPPLVAHAPEVLASNRSYLITVLLYGLRGKIEIKGQKARYNGAMPNHYELTDEEAASVLNYVLASWGNDRLLPADFKPITAAEIRAERNRKLTPQQVYEIRQHLTLGR
jgi:mono/diheme cytochrome c family protein